MKRVIIVFLILFLGILLSYKLTITSNGDYIVAYNDVSTSRIVETIYLKDDNAITTSTQKIEESLITKNINTTNNVQINNDNLVIVDNGVNEKYIKKVNEQLDLLPKKIISKLKSDGWHIYVTGENLSRKYFHGKYKSVQGVTRYKEKSIYLEARDRAIKESTLHEIGHYVDFILGGRTTTNNYSILYEEELELFKSRINNSDCVSDKRELFAEEFYYLFTDESKCTEKIKEYILNSLQKI